MNSVELEAYEKVKRLAKVAKKDLQKKVATVIDGLGDPYLVRAKPVESRIKSPSSLARKAKQQRWSFAEALFTAQDLVGLRLVCHNLQDVRRVADLLEAALRGDGLNVNRHDYVTKPTRNGYQAIHLMIQMTVRLGTDE
jgi:ppGpp synthetase/RelA/SpoT-type nucleotidyltranferase